MQSAPSLTPQLKMVDGKPVIMESSLTVQAQAEDFQRTILVEDNPVSHSTTMRMLPCLSPSR